MAKLTKNRKESLTKFDAEKMYSLKEASDVIKSFSKLKFDPSIDLAVNLGVDPKKGGSKRTWNCVVAKWYGKRCKGSCSGYTR